MSTGTSTPSRKAADLAAPLVERQLALLGRLAEIGLEVAGAVERRAKAATEKDDLAGLAMAYARVARAVRLTAMLQSRLVKDLQGLEAEAASRAESEALAQEQSRRRLEHERKMRAGRIIERVIGAEVEDDDAFERLAEETYERLDDEDLYGEIAGRPMGEVVALICRDLGLRPDWAGLAGEPWARAEIESGAAGSPFLAARAAPGGTAVATAEREGGVGAVRPLMMVGDTS